jgi:uncharacterized membrane protein
MTEKKSKRFSPSLWTQRLVPIVLVLLAIGLLVTLVIVILSVLGLTPAV